MVYKARSSPSGPVGNALVRGTNLTLNPDLTLSPLSRPRRFFDWDYFCSGGLTGSTLGRMGWTLSGTGSPVATRQNSTFISSIKYRITTGATSGNRASVTLGDTEARLVAKPSQATTTQIVWRYGATLANKRNFFGWADDFALDPLTAQNALGVVTDSNVSPYLLVLSRTAGVTRVLVTADSLGIAANTFAITQFLQQPSGDIDVYANGTTSLATPRLIATIPAAFTNFDANHGWRTETLTNATTRIDLAYWGMNSSILDGVYSSDNFLEI